MARSRAGVADSHMTAGISPGGDLRFHSFPVFSYLCISASFSSPRSTLSRIKDADKNGVSTPSFFFLSCETCHWNIVCFLSDTSPQKWILPVLLKYKDATPAPFLCGLPFRTYSSISSCCWTLQVGFCAWDEAATFPVWKERCRASGPYLAARPWLVDIS